MILIKRTVRASYRYKCLWQLKLIRCNVTSFGLLIYFMPSLMKTNLLHIQQNTKYQEFYKFSAVLYALTIEKKLNEKEIIESLMNKDM
jgi:hypothetical protein